MDLGDEIRKLRVSKGYTQESLSKKIDISRKALWNYENNKRVPSISMLRRIGKALGVDLSYLLSKTPSIDTDTAAKIHKLGWGSEVMELTDSIPEEEKLQKFKEFLSSYEFPYDIDEKDLDIILEKTKQFLAYEFFKLGYIKVTKD
ncbi:helix-turn-helix transcriptional regulator [Clostridium baratii]